MKKLENKWIDMNTFEPPSITKLVQKINELVEDNKELRKMIEERENERENPITGTIHGDACMTEPCLGKCGSTVCDHMIDVSPHPDHIARAHKKVIPQEQAQAMANATSDRLGKEATIKVEKKCKHKYAIPQPDFITIECPCGSIIEIDTKQLCGDKDKRIKELKLALKLARYGLVIKDKRIKKLEDGLKDIKRLASRNVFEANKIVTDTLKDNV